MPTDYVHEGLCRKIASRYVKAGTADHDDLLGVLRLKCWQLEKTFDPTKGVPFTSYAWSSLNGRAARALRKLRSHVADGDLHDLPAAPVEATADMRAVEARALVDQLPPGAVRAIARGRLAGWSYQRLAVALGISRARVRHLYESEVLPSLRVLAEQGL